MGISLIFGTTIILLSQYFIDFIIKDSKKKNKIGTYILVTGIILLWISFFLQKYEKNQSDIDHTKEITNQENRFNSLDSINISLSTELKLRNNDLAIIKHQNDSMKIQLQNIQEKQNDYLIISQYSAKEVNKSRVALENMGYKQISRGISEIDKIQMINILKKNEGSKVTVKAIMGDSEALQFAVQVKEVFIAAGWIADGIDQSLYSKPMKGIFIEIKSENYPIRVNTIFESFKVLNMIAEGNINPIIDDNKVEILIGTK